MRATVKRLTERGFGFLSAEDGKEYFLYRTDMAPGSNWFDLDEGMTVSFEPVTPVPSKGPRAERVTIIEASS